MAGHPEIAAAADTTVPPAQPAQPLADPPAQPSVAPVDLPSPFHHASSEIDAGTEPHAGTAPLHPEPVPTALRQRIVADQYVELGLLLNSAERSSGDSALMSVQVVDGILRPTARAPRVVTSFGQWCTAFLRFAGVYIVEHPTAAAGLLAHMRQVCQLTAPGLGLASREYDVAFRQAREQSPAQYRWGETASSSPLWLQAVARGIGGATSTAAAGSSRSLGSVRFRRTGVCYNFNNARGCHSQSCRFLHSCRLCRGAHPAARCPTQIRSQRQRPNAISRTPPTAGASR